MGIKVEEDLLFEKLRISLPEAVCDGVVDEKTSFLHAIELYIY